MTERRVLLVVEDGTEYTDAFRALAGNDSGVPVELVRAGNAEEAAGILCERGVDAVFLDVVFDRSPPDRLAGDLESEVRRFGGDRRRAERHLAENQGFYLFNELAPLLPDGIPVVIAYDFSAEPERLEVLRRKRRPLSGITDGTPISSVVGSLLASLTTDDKRGGPP